MSLNLDYALINKDEIISLIEPDHDDIIYITGSLLDGVGDEFSDIDIYVLTSNSEIERRRQIFSNERKKQQERLGFGIQYIQFNDKEIDIEFHTVSKIIYLVKELKILDTSSFKGVFESFKSLGNFERDHALDMLHRFKIAKPIHNIGLFNDILAEFDLENYKRWNTYYYLDEVYTFAKGTERSLKNRDFLSAYIKLLRVYDSLVDAYMFSNNKGYDRWKWRVPKLSKIQNTRLKDIYWELYTSKIDMKDEEFIINFINDKLEKLSFFISEIKKNTAIKF